MTQDVARPGEGGREESIAHSVVRYTHLENEIKIKIKNSNVFVQGNPTLYRYGRYFLVDLTDCDGMENAEVRSPCGNNKYSTSIQVKHISPIPGGRLRP
jgi:hypothetical protein